MEHHGDSTIYRSKKRHLSDSEENAMYEMFGGELECPYCKHPRRVHAVLLAQPYVHVHGKKKILRKFKEVLESYCLQCAEEKRTRQCLCFKHHSGFGEEIYPAEKVHA